MHLVLVTCALALQPAKAAQETSAPSVELRKTAGANLVGVEALGRGEGRLYRFAVRHRYFGPGQQDSLELPLDDETLLQLNPGARYLLAYTELVRTQRADKGLRQVPPQLVRTLAAGELIAAMSPGLLALLDGTVDRLHADDHCAIAVALLALLESSDPRTARIVAGDLLGRPGIEHQLQPAELDRIAALIGDVDRDAAARATLVGFALARHDAFDAAWWSTGVASVLERTPVQLPDGRGWPALVAAALRLASVSGTPARPVPVDRWLHCPHPGVVEAALAAIARSEPQRLEQAVATALRVPFIASGAREALRGAQQRIE